jgi:acetyl-CoA carboxylase biotin carboxyl carrier protein
MKKTARKSSPKAEAKPAAKPAPKTRPAEIENLTLDEVRELIHLIAEKQFTEFELERGKFRMRLGRGAATKVVTEIVPHIPVQSESLSGDKAAGALASAPAATTTPTVTPAPQEENLHVVSSPIVGTFYRSSSPTAEPFAQVGDSITTGKTLCIIEAMKLMNEIQADVGGVVAKIFVENGQPVEFGQPLFGIKV